MTALKPTILYIEDNEDSEYMLSRRLKKRGFNVVTSTDGKAGVETAEAILPDLILMDLHLPAMDGWAATRHLKYTKTTTHIPIIAVSSHVLQGERDQALNAGCDEYETKPINFEVLMDKIAQLLE